MTVVGSLQAGVDSNGLLGDIQTLLTTLNTIASLADQLASGDASPGASLVALLGDLNLPGVELPADFAGGLQSALNALPDDPAVFTSIATAPLAELEELVTERIESIIGEAVVAATAIQTLLNISFDCGDDAAAGDTPPADPVPGPAPSERLGQTGAQLQSVKARLDLVPPDTTPVQWLVLLLTTLGSEEGKSRDDFFRINIPFIDDVIEPLQTLARWSLLTPQQIGDEMAATMQAMASQLDSMGGGAVQRLNTDSAALTAVLPRDALNDALTAQVNGLGALLDDLENNGAAEAAQRVAALNTTLDSLDPLAAQLNADLLPQLMPLCAQLDSLAESVFSALTQFILQLQPIHLPVAGLTDLTAAFDPIPPSVVGTIDDAVQPVIDLMTDLLDVVDFSAINGEFAAVAAEAEAIAATINSATTDMAIDLGSQIQVVTNAISSVDSAGFVSSLSDQVSAIGDQLEQTLGDELGSTLGAVADAISALAAAVDQFDPAVIVNALQDVITSIADVLSAPAIQGPATALKDAITALVETLESVSFTVVTDEAVDLIEGMRDALQALSGVELAAPLSSALDAAISALPDDLEPHTDPLLVEFGERINSDVIPLLQPIADAPAAILDQVRQFEPALLIGGQLSGPYEDLLDTLDQFEPDQLLDPLEQALDQLKARLTESLSAEALVDDLNQQFDAVSGQLQQYSPETLLLPLENAIEATVNRILDASPVDEALAEINGVFDSISAVLAVGNDIRDVLQRIADVLNQAADADAVVDQFRDDILDAITSVADVTPIQSALAGISAAVAASRHVNLLAAFESAVAPLEADLQLINPAGRVTELVNLHLQLQAASGNITDVGLRGSVDAMLARFDPLQPLHIGPIARLSDLADCITVSRASLVAMEDDWAGTLDHPQGPLAELATAGADLAAIRTMLEELMEPVLLPLRSLFQTLGRIAVPVTALLNTVVRIVDELTSRSQALVDGPGSLGAVSDAVNGIVDALRGIDLGPIRATLVAPYDALVSQVEGLNPAQLLATFDQELNDLLSTISIGALIDNPALDNAGVSYHALVDKLRTLNPEQLIAEQVQPLFDDTVDPLLDAFDLTPAFTALIEFLGDLEGELRGELGRVNGAYQQFLEARPA